MELTAALTAIAAQIGMDANQLIQYADDYQGDNERKVLNAIVRTLQPRNCLELGTHTGEGTTCILAALSHVYEKHITTVDISTDTIIGSAIPANLRPYVTLVNANIDVWIGEQSGYDFIFDDAAHSIHQVQEIYKWLDQLLNPGGVIMSHDAAVEGIGAYIREGQMKCGYDLPVYQIDPLPWGYSVYRKPGWEIKPKPEIALGESVETTPELLRAAANHLSEIADEIEAEVVTEDLDAIVHEAVEIDEKDLPQPQAKTRKARATRKGSRK